MSEPGPAGFVVVDKPAGLTSQDVVGRIRRALGIRRVGHAGTLDPMATGVLIVGLGRATRLLTFLVGADKAYRATVRLGWSSDTDDADGHLQRVADPARLAAVGDDEILAAMSGISQTRLQVPSSVSAIKVEGRRAYQRVRSGESVTLPARPVAIHRFEALSISRGSRGIDVDVDVECSSGTYVRALARDLGAALAVGGHLVALRRTRVGPFRIEDAVPLADFVAAAQAGERVRVLEPGQAAEAFLPTWFATGDDADALGHGRRVPWPAGVPQVITAALTGNGDLIAVVEPVDGVARALAVLADSPARVSSGRVDHVARADQSDHG